MINKEAGRVGDLRYAIAGGISGAVIGGKIGQKAFDKSIKSRKLTHRLRHNIRMKVFKKYRKQHNLDRMSAIASGAELGGSFGGYAGLMKDLQRSIRRVHRDYGNYGKNWEKANKPPGSGGGGGYRARSYPDLSTHLKTVGIPKGVKKKSEAKKIYIKKVFSIHPDRNPGMDDGPLKDLNNAWDEIKKTSWYEKLAFILDKRSYQNQALSNVSFRASLKLTL